MRERAEATSAAMACYSVGVDRFDITEKIDALKEKDNFQKIEAEEFLRQVPHLVRRATERGHSFIVRPRGEGLIQADDLGAASLARIRPLAFLGVQTSWGNFQGWVCVTDAADLGELRRRLLRGCGADTNASGAMRWPGSFNLKHLPAPLVRVEFINYGRRCTVAELEAAGLLAPPEDAPPAPAAPVHPASSPRTWGEYYVSRDRSKADFRYSCDGLRAGFSVEEIAARLVTLEGSKAKERGLKYALTTARKAAREVGGHDRPSR